MTSSINESMAVERLFLRLASLSSPDQIAVFVKTHLIEAIGYVCSTNDTVRQESVELLTHLNKRLRANPEVPLPVDFLLEEYLKSTNTASLNFLIIYIKMGYQRLTEGDKLKLLPVLTKAMSGKSETHKNDLLTLYVPVLACLCKLDRDKWPENALPDDRTIRTELLSFILDILLLPSFDSSQLNFREVEVSAPPGMTQAGYNRVKNLADQHLVALKCNLVKFLGVSKFEPSEFLLHFTIASADPDHTVVSCGEMEMKKLYLNDWLDNKNFVTKLFQLFTGTKSIRRATSTRQRLKLFPFLLKSKVASMHFPQNIQLIFECWFEKSQQDMPIPIKIKIQATQFAVLVIDNCPSQGLLTFGPILWSGLRKLLAQNNDVKLAMESYLALGRVGCQCPNLVCKDLSFVQQMFESVSNEREDVASSVADCLTAWIPIFSSTAEGHTKKVLETLVSGFVKHPSIKCRLLALKYLEALFDNADLPSKWNLCWSSGDSEDEIKREAKTILEACVKSNKPLPSFKEVIDFFSQKFESEKSDVTTEITKTAVTFLRCCLLRQSGVIENNTMMDLSLESLIENSPLATKFISNLEPSIVLQYYSIVMNLCVKQAGVLHFGFLSEIVFSKSETLVGIYDIRALVGQKVNWLKDSIMTSSSPDFCTVCAGLFACVVKTEDIANLLKQCTQEIKHFVEPPVGLLYLISHLYIALRHNNDQCDIDDEIESLLVSYIDLVRPNTMTTAACDTLAEVYRWLPSSLSNEKQQSLIKDVGKMVQSTKETIKPKLKENALRILGFFLTESDEPLHEQVSQALMDVANGLPQPDLQLLVGESLLNCVLGTLSPARRNLWLDTENEFLDRQDKNMICPANRIENLLIKLSQEKMPSSNRHVRQAALIWLFVIVKQSCSWHPVVQMHLTDLQSAFIDGLAESNEFTQGVSSKALSVMYEKSTKEQQESMVSILVESLTTGRRTAARQVTGDTELFSKGTLGNTPGGESLSTYRELCSLATDLNKPDLVYKFMQLANHQSMWNSKMGAAFGVGGVLEQAREQLEPHFPQLVPKLYRYRYDPDPKVQSAVRSIWQALTSSRKGVVDEFADNIFKETVSSLTDSHWRIRESSCLALSDLLSGHCTIAMTERFAELWETLFRIQDDIKESVRLAANRAVTTLQKLTIKYCSADRGKNASDLLKMVLPVLLDKGMNCLVKDTKKISLGTVVSLSKEAGPTLRPHLQLLVPCLLETLSQVEPAFFNYLAVRSDENELEKLDAVRANAAKGSPLMDSLYICVRYIDVPTLISLCPALTNLLRSSVGLTTRTGTCSFILAICTQCQKELYDSKSVADDLVRALSHGLDDRNGTVRKQYANAVAHLAKFCSFKTMKQLLSRLIRGYLEQKANADVALAHICHGLCQHNPEALKEYGPQVAPIILLAMHKEESETSLQPIIVLPEDIESGTKLKKMWEEAWTELCPGTEGGMRLYKAEILEFCRTLLIESGVWSIKANAAEVMGQLINYIGSELEFAHAQSLLELLEQCLGGRTWTGKQRIFGAISNLWVSCGTNLRNNLTKVKMDEHFEVLFKECRKKNVPYRTSALNCVSVFCEEAVYGKGCTQLLELVQPILIQNQSLYDSDDEQESNLVERRTEKIEFEVVAVKVLVKSGQHCNTETKVIEIIDLFVRILPGAYWKVQQEVICGFRKLLESPRSVRPFVTNDIIICVVSILKSGSQVAALMDDTCKLLKFLLDMVIDGRFTLVSDKNILNTLNDLETHEMCLSDASLQNSMAQVRKLVL